MAINTFEIPGLPSEVTIHSLPSVYSLNESQFSALMLSDEVVGIVGKYWQASYKDLQRVNRFPLEQKIQYLVSVIEGINRRFPDNGKPALRRAYYQLGITIEDGASDKLVGEIGIAQLLANQIFPNREAIVMTDSDYWPWK